MGIANECYTSLEKTFSSMGYLNVRVKTLQDFSLQGEEDFFTGELTLLPLFFCYGTHAEKDLFQNEDSIASCLKKRGIHLKENKQGLLESEAFCNYLCQRIAGEEEWNENW
jgi:cobalamin biosynthesis Co2+ chelatase CbiK